MDQETNTELNYQPQVKNFTFSNIKQTHKLNKKLFFVIFGTLLLLFFITSVILLGSNFNTNSLKSEKSIIPQSLEQYRIPNSKQYYLEGYLTKYDNNFVYISPTNEAKNIIRISYDFSSNFYINKNVQIKQDAATPSSEIISIIQFPENALIKINLNKKVNAVIINNNNILSLQELSFTN